MRKKSKRFAETIYKESKKRAATEEKAPVAARKFNKKILLKPRSQKAPRQCGEYSGRISPIILFRSFVLHFLG